MSLCHTSVPSWPLNARVELPAPSPCIARLSASSTAALLRPALLCVSHCGLWTANKLFAVHLAPSTPHRNMQHILRVVRRGQPGGAFSRRRHGALVSPVLPSSWRLLHFEPSPSTTRWDTVVGVCCTCFVHECEEHCYCFNLQSRQVFSCVRLTPSTRDPRCCIAQAANANNIDGMVALMAPDGVYFDRGASGTEVRGSEEVRAALNSVVVSAFPRVVCNGARFLSLSVADHIPCLDLNRGTGTFEWAHKV